MESAAVLQVSSHNRISCLYDDYHTELYKSIILDYVQHTRSHSTYHPPLPTTNLIEDETFNLFWWVPVDGRTTIQSSFKMQMSW